MADIKLNDLPTAISMDDAAVLPFSQEQAGTPTSFKMPITDIGAKIAEDLTFSNLQTAHKTLVEAINDAATGSGGTAQGVTYDNTDSGLAAENVKDAIDEVVSDMTTKTDITSSVQFTEDITGTNTRVYAKNGIVFIFYQGESKTHSANDLLFTLPSGYRPSDLIYNDMVINNTGYGNVSIKTNGECLIAQVANGLTAGRVYFSMSFPI